jgi:hypothetical protein
VIEYFASKVVLASFKRITHNKRLVAILVFATTIDLDYFATRSLHLNWDVIHRVSFYYFYWILAALYLWREHKDMPDRHRDKAPAAAWVLGFCIVGSLYYMALLGFAYGVYPQIPAAKGGGNYANTPDVEFYWKSDSLLSIPTNFVVSSGSQTNTVKKSIRLKIIEESSSDIYVAIPDDQDGPTNWSTWHTPQVTGLQRATIISRVYFAPHQPRTNHMVTGSP